MSKPASISFSRVSSDQHLGPIVQRILVDRGLFTRFVINSKFVLVDLNVCTPHDVRPPLEIQKKWLLRP